jgi:hypothetical protein
MKSIIISRFLKDAMTRTDIRDVLNRQIADGRDVVVAGWLRSVRTSKGGLHFSRSTTDRVSTACRSWQPLRCRTTNPKSSS